MQIRELHGYVMGLSTVHTKLLYMQDTDRPTYIAFSHADHHSLDHVRCDGVHVC